MIGNPYADILLWVRIWVGWEYTSIQNFNSNFLSSKQEKSSENLMVFGTFMAKVHDLNTILQKLAMQQQLAIT